MRNLRPCVQYYAIIVAHSLILNFLSVDPLYNLNQAKQTVVEQLCKLNEELNQLFFVYFDKTYCFYGVAKKVSDFSIAQMLKTVWQTMVVLINNNVGWHVSLYSVTQQTLTRQQSSGPGPAFLLPESVTYFSLFSSLSRLINQSMGYLESVKYIL